MADIRVTPLLDDFNRADENPIASPWGQVDTTAFPNQCRLQSLRLRATVGGFNVSYYGGVGPFDGDMEVWGVTSGSSAFTEGWYTFLLKDVGGSNTVDGYRIGWINSVGTNRVQLRRITNGVSTLIQDNGVGNGNIPANGNYVLMRTVGAEIEYWHSADLGATWVQLLTHTDNTYRTGLYLGLGMVLSSVGPTWSGLGGGVATTWIPQIYRRIYTTRALPPP